MKIEKVNAIEILDSRGNPTVEVVITSYSIHYTKLYDPDSLRIEGAPAAGGAFKRCTSRAAKLGLP